MDSRVLKIVLLWTVCEIIGLTRTIPLGENMNPNIRTKRSPSESFSLFGLSPFSVPNPISKARDSFSNFRNIFAPTSFSNERIDRNHYSSINMQPTNRQNNGMALIDNTYKNGVPNLMTQYASFEESDENIVRQKHKNKVDEPENYLLHDSNTKPENNVGAPENDTNQNSENNIDKKLLEYIFQTTPDYNIDNTTVDTTVDSTTETGDYESFPTKVEFNSHLRRQVGIKLVMLWSMPILIFLINWLPY